VRWETDPVFEECYSIGAEGKYDLAFCDDIFSEPGFTILDETNIRLGIRVQRGCDWSWWDQDGGPGKYGTVQGFAYLGGPKFGRGNPDEGWCHVQWVDSGESEYYRVGFKGQFDLLADFTSECVDLTNNQVVDTRVDNSSAIGMRPVDWDSSSPTKNRQTGIFPLGCGTRCCDVFAVGQDSLCCKQL